MADFSIAGRLRSFPHAIRGLRDLIHRQHNARIHAAATVAALALGWLSRLTRQEWGILVLAIAAVWAAEAFNTALESLADAVHPERHPLVGRAKDAAAAAVLVAAIASVIVGGLLFLPRLAALLADGP